MKSEETNNDEKWDNQSNWEPEDHPDFQSLMPTLSEQVLNDLLAAENEEKRHFLLDTQEIHERLYAQFTWTNYEDCAGHYRFTPDTKVANWPVAVNFKIGDSERILYGAISRENLLTQLDATNEKIKNCIENPPDDKKLLAAKIVTIAIEFLRMHPYANGNGHISRLMFPVMASFSPFTVKNGWSVNPSSYTPEMKIAFCESLANDSGNRRDGMLRLINFFEDWLD